MVKYCSEASERGLCGLGDETMICTCSEPDLAEIASLARAGSCATDQVRCRYIPLPPQTQTGATCLFLFFAMQYFSTYFLPPLSSTHTNPKIKKETKKNLPLAPPISKSCKALSPLSYRTQIGLRRPTLPPIRPRYRFSLRNLHKIIHSRCSTQLGQLLHQTTR